MTTLVTCDSKDLLVTYLYDEASPPEREAVETHLAACERCRDELQALGGVRETLGAWDAPALASHVRVESGPRAVAAPRRRWWIAAPLAAAAVLVLAAGAGLARLEIRYGVDGVTVRTGGGWTTERAGVGVASPMSAGTAGADDQAWKSALAALERQLRAEFAAKSAGGTGNGPGGRTAVGVAAPVGTRTSEQELLRRVQQLIDESEVRQQRNLALRMAEVSHDFSLQRQADLVEIQQGFGRLEGRTEAEAARQRELMNYIMRVSQPQPPR